MSVQEFVDSNISSNDVMMFSKTFCPFCTKAKKALKSAGMEFKVIELENNKDCSKIQDYLLKKTGGRSVPRVFIKGKFFGGGDECAAGAKNGALKKALTG